MYGNRSMMPSCSYPPFFTIICYTIFSPYCEREPLPCYWKKCRVNKTGRFLWPERIRAQEMKCQLRGQTKLPLGRSLMWRAAKGRDGVPAAASGPTTGKLELSRDCSKREAAGRTERAANEKPLRHVYKRPLCLGGAKGQTRRDLLS